MVKITFMGAGSTIFARNVLGDCMSTPTLQDSEICLYDIDAQRLGESELMLKAINANINAGRAVIKSYLGVENRKEALRGADFVVDAIQVGGEEVCPNALFINYTNPMSMLTGFMQRYTPIKTIGLCHSVQVCSEWLLKPLGMADKLERRKELIAGINHMGWLLDIRDQYGNDLYPEIRKRAREKNAEGKHFDMVRYEYINRFGYYCTESSEHNAEYNPFFIKNRYPELIDRFNIPLDEYPRRCVNQIAAWDHMKKDLVDNPALGHERSREYASYLMESIVTGNPYEIGGNVLNNGLIDNLPANACVEVPCLVDGYGIHPCHVGALPPQLAALNMTHINVHLLTIEAAVTQKREHIYHAAMLDPHTAAELSIDHIVKMVDELIDAHGHYLPAYH